jgi:hypothetical protein
MASLAVLGKHHGYILLVVLRRFWLGRLSAVTLGCERFYSLGMAMLIPPSAITMAPTMKLAFSDAKNATTSAISSGFADRLMGAFLPCVARNSLPSRIFLILNPRLYFLVRRRMHDTKTLLRSMRLSAGSLPRSCHPLRPFSIAIPWLSTCALGTHKRFQLWSGACAPMEF